MIDGSEKRNRQLAFELQNSHICEKRSNDLPSAFQNILSDPIILPNGTKLNSLLYADDLIIISRSKIGLPNCLNTLSSFCNSWMLDMNSK